MKGEIFFKYYNLGSGVFIYTVILGMWLICETLKVVYMYLSNYYDKVIFFFKKNKNKLLMLSITDKDL